MSQTFGDVGVIVFKNVVWDSNLYSLTVAIRYLEICEGQGCKLRKLKPVDWNEWSVKFENQLSE